jgi:aryl-alcohol dehydrogenase-like predicted oxidoreductase
MQMRKLGKSSLEVSAIGLVLQLYFVRMLESTEIFI